MKNGVKKIIYQIHTAVTIIDSDYTRDVHYEHNDLYYPNDDTNFEHSRIEIAFEPRSRRDKLYELMYTLRRLFPDIEMHMFIDDGGDYDWFTIRIDINKDNPYEIDMDGDDFELWVRLNK